MTSSPKRFGSPDKYGLPDIHVGDTKRFEGVTPELHDRVKRSAHNYNSRTSMYFLTRLVDDVLYVTRLQ